MRLLLDTHTALWLREGDERLSKPARALLGDPTHEHLISAVVAWEIAVKRVLGKLDAPDDIVERLLGSGAVELPITIEHAEASARLPWHHRDPFDRMLVAQATTEDATLLSSDAKLSAYDVNVTW